MTFGLLTMTRRGLVAAAVIIAATSCAATATSPSPSSSDVAAASPADSPTPTFTPPPPASTPEGTPAPHPAEVTVDSADIATPTPVPAATPTPSPQPGLWRIDGYVVDQNGAPLQSVCVVIGPRGCWPYSPHTDARGYWFIDIAEGHSGFDFYFELPGYDTVWWQTNPTGPTTHNVILAKS